MQVRCARAMTFAGPYVRLRRRWYSSAIPGIPDFAFYPNVLDDKEQATLLHACLRKLDLGESRRMRRRREQYLATRYCDTGTVHQNSEHPADLFLPDDLYQFEEVRPAVLFEVPP